MSEAAEGLQLRGKLCLLCVGGCGVALSLLGHLRVFVYSLRELELAVRLHIHTYPFLWSEVMVPAFKYLLQGTLQYP